MKTSKLNPLNSKINLKNKTIFFLLVITFVFTFPLFTNAFEKCDFTRDLKEDVIGEDVRCLQKYLNGSGFTISTEGISSPGNETNIFREKTKEAIIKWQKKQMVFHQADILALFLDKNMLD